MAGHKTVICVLDTVCVPPTAYIYRYNLVPLTVPHMNVLVYDMHILDGARITSLSKITDNWQCTNGHCDADSLCE